MQNKKKFKAQKHKAGVKKVYIARDENRDKNKFWRK